MDLNCYRIVHKSYAHERFRILFERKLNIPINSFCFMNNGIHRTLRFLWYMQFSFSNYEWRETFLKVRIRVSEKK